MERMVYQQRLLMALADILKGKEENGINDSVQLGFNLPFIWDVRISSRPTLRSKQPPTQWVRVALSLGVMREGCEAEHSPPTSA
jgi:hypothetical protein